MSQTDGGYQQELLKWIVVKAGFHKWFEGNFQRSALEFTEWSGVPAEELEEKPNYFCCLEPAEKGPLVTGLAAVPNQGLVETFFLDATVLQERATPLLRLPELVVQSLSGKKVVVIGLGSGGAEIALNLACAGVGRFDLVDYDTCQPENYFRHVADKRDLGRRKVAAVKSAIEDRELSAEVNTSKLDVIGDADEFRALLEPMPDLLICSTDSLVSRRFLNCCSILLNIPMVIAGTLDGGRIGEVIIVLPKKTACYDCIRLDLGAALIQPESDDRSLTPYIDSEEETLKSAAFRSDITCIASLAARASLVDLAPELFPPMPESYIVWGRDAGSTFAAPFQFNTPLGINYVKVRRRRDCPVCGDLPSELVGVDVTKKATEILDEIDNQSRMQPEVSN